MREAQGGETLKKSVKDSFLVHWIMYLTCIGGYEN